MRILELRQFVAARDLALRGGDQKLPAWAEALYAPVLEARFEERLAEMAERREE